MPGKPGQKVNIAEVARIAGVSKMTVSRMLNHKAKVAPDTRKKVQKVMDELKYQPSPFARGLASQKSRILGIMIFDGMNMDFLTPIFLGIEHEARINGYDLLIFSNPEKDKESHSLSFVDGVLCFGYEMDNVAVENLEKRNIPYAVIGKRQWRKASPWYCTMDYFNGYRKRAAHLIGMGHRKMAFMGGLSSYYVDTEKYDGFHAAFQEAGLSPKNSLILHDGDVSNFRESIEQFRPTAVFLENTVYPFPFLFCVKELGLKIPEDISVIYTRSDFIDSHTLFNLAGIHELTQLAVPRRELGIAGLRLLLKLIDGENDIPKEQLLELQFFEGESCAPPPLRKRT